MTRRVSRFKAPYLPKESPYKKIKKDVRLVDSKHRFFPGKTAEQINQLCHEMDAMIKRKKFPNIDSYIHSSCDRLDLVSVKPVDLLKEHGGQGVFADDVIPKDTCLGIYTGVCYSSKQYKTYLNSNPNANTDYAMTIAGKIVDASDSGNFTRYINYSDTQYNLEFVEKKIKSGSMVSIIASRAIAKGEQLLINYNVYDSRAARLFYFLNPQDNDLSSTQFYNQHKKQYKKIKIMKSDSPFFDLKKQEKIVMTLTGLSVIRGRDLSSELPVSEINYPYLRIINTSGKKLTIMDFAKKDVFTPLMLACYLGHYHNVKYLVNNHAYIDQKQSQSGYYPLLFALQGYYLNKTYSEHFLKVICFLIQHNANILACDRQDKTFLHRAISVLSETDFNIVVQEILQKKSVDFDHLLTYVDENGFDLIHTALKGKYYGAFLTLLLATPDYFKLHTSKNKTERAWHQSVFRRALEGYSSEERDILFTICQDDRLTVSPDFSFEPSHAKTPSFFQVRAKSMPDSNKDDASLNILADAAYLVSSSC